MLLLNSILNSKQAVRKITVGTSNTLTSHTFDVSAMLNNYKTLSVDDFEIVTTGTSYTITQSNNPVTQQTLSKSYDADNGALTISNCLSNIYSSNYGGYVKTYIKYSICDILIHIPM